MAIELDDVSTALGARLATGSVESHSAGPLGWLLALIAGVPAHGSTCARLEIRGSDRGDVWTRTYGCRRQVSRVEQIGDVVEERFGPFTFELAGVNSDPRRLELRRTRIGRRCSVGPMTFTLRSLTTRAAGRLRCQVDAALFGGRLGRLHYDVELHEGNEGDRR